MKVNPIKRGQKSFKGTHNYSSNVAFRVLTAVIMKGSIVWDNVVKPVEK
jgi:hypothetical protein